jgi:small subunit ribosomal protein S6
MNKQNFYESVFIARPDMTINDFESMVFDLSNIVEKMEGQVIKKEYWGLRNLAYPIKKHARGHYKILYIKGTFKMIKELERNYKMKEDIIRYLTIKVKKIDKEASKMMQIPDENK